MTNSTKNHANLPTVEFSRSGPVSAAESAYVGEASGDSVPVWIHHPGGGSVLVGFERTLAFAENLAAELNDVIGAWARHAITPDS